MSFLPWSRQDGGLLQAELEQRLTGYRELLSFLGCGDGRSTSRTGEDTYPSPLSSACDPADQSTQARATNNFFRGFRTFSAPLDLVRVG